MTLALMAVAVACVTAESKKVMTAPKKVEFEGRTVPLHAYMQEHFVRTEIMHRALVAGDLDRVRAEAQWVVDRPEAEGIPSGWAPFIARMKIAGADIVDATNPGEMAYGVGSMGVVCGDCHTKLKVDAGFAWNPPPAPSNDARRHMLRHQWATDRFWDALVTADDEAWFAASEVFEDESLHPSDLGGEELDPHILTPEDKVHGIGEEAGRAYDSMSRVKIFAKLLSTCAGCHEKYKRGPESPPPL